VAVDAVIFDFNGTLSDDEGLLYRLFQEIFARRFGFDLKEEFYFDRLAGLSDYEIVSSLLHLLGSNDDSVKEMVVKEKVELYQAAVRESPCIYEEVVRFVKQVGEYVPVGVVTGVVHEEVDVALDAVGLLEPMSFVIAGDDVTCGKPDPEGYMKGLRCLDASVQPCNVVVFEDSMPGLTAAWAAGTRPIAVLGTLSSKQLPPFVERSVARISLQNCSWLFDELVIRRDKV
jgi:beta-phosphoglucomutase